MNRETEKLALKLAKMCGNGDMFMGYVCVRSNFIQLALWHQRAIKRATARARLDTVRMMRGKRPSSTR